MRKRALGLSIVALLIGVLVSAVIWGEYKPVSTPVVDTSPVVVPEVIELDPYGGVLVVESDGGQGSCFVVAEQDGWFYAITAQHVVEDDDYDRSDFGFDPILTVDDEEYEAEIVRVSSHEDVALIRFQSPETYTIYSFGRAIAGEACVTIGWSDGSRLIYKGNIISTDLRGYVAANGGAVPGCSGGVLLNSDMEILGVTVRVSMYRGGYWDSTMLYTPARYAEALLMTIGD